MATATRDLMSTSEAARVLGVSSETLRLWARQGRIPFADTPIGRLYAAEVIHDMAAARERIARERAQDRRR